MLKAVRSDFWMIGMEGRVVICETFEQNLFELEHALLDLPQNQLGIFLAFCHL